ncbi:MAG: hypothetical protein ABSE73_27815 [Planctomycetota bacterium]
MNDPAEFDPGRFWRRTARWGGLLCALACAVPMTGSRWECIWNVLPEILRVSSRGQAGPPQRLPLAVFASLVLPAVFSGPVVLLTGGSCLNGNPRLRIMLVTLLWASAVLPSFFFGLIQLNLWARNDTGLQAGAAASMAFLFMCGMTALMAWSARGKPSCFFWLGVVPLSEAVLAWAALCVMLVLVTPSSHEQLLYLIIPACAAGSLLMLFGWLKWWAAVRRFMRSA